MPIITIYFFQSTFEPLLNGIKGLLILGVSIMALIGAVEAAQEDPMDQLPGSSITYRIAVGPQYSQQLNDDVLPRSWLQPKLFENDSIQIIRDQKT